MKKRSGKTRTGRTRHRARALNAHRFASAKPPKAVFLVGFMGAGKSSVGQALALHLNWVFEDLDDRIERRENRSIAGIFRTSGEAEFRRAEHAALEELLQELASSAGQRGRIIALGGGAFVQKRNAMLLQAAGASTIFLDAPVSELWLRCCTQASKAGTERPLLQNQKQFRELYRTRRPGYAEASLRVRTANRRVAAIAREIAELLGLKVTANRTQQGEVQ